MTMTLVESATVPRGLHTTDTRALTTKSGLVPRVRPQATERQLHTPAHVFCKRLARRVKISHATIQGYQSSPDSDYREQKKVSLAEFPFSDPDLDDFSRYSSTPSTPSTSEKSSEEGLPQYRGAFRGVADDPSIHNPLDRQNRLGCGWMGVLLEWEGVIVGDYSEEHKQAWLQLAEEEGKSPPLAFILKKTEGMKNEQVISEVFCWSRNPMEVRRLAHRKEELFKANVGTMEYQVNPGIIEFLLLMKKNDVPCAVVTSAPASVVEPALDDLGLESLFTTVVTGDDVERHRPDPDGYMYAAMGVGRVNKRCIVIGNHNSVIEAAFYAGMKSIALSTNRPAYELASADLVVRQLDELSVVNLKQLFRMEDLENADEPELELEEEEEARPMSTTMFEDDDW
mmetsp:Transcript_24845/g.41532  ORF Transcript_24845/g.41532 Transcript_24845/m.41532 type:complete len:398 (+) Transcript_24845:276-1469(+)